MRDAEDEGRGTPGLEAERAIVHRRSGESQVAGVLGGEFWMASGEDVTREAAIAAWTRWMLTWTTFIWNWPTPEDFYDSEDLNGFGGEY